jgi:mRNA-degrading endonuclease RelE of RelBE toxin-antitoxin system
MTYRLEFTPRAEQELDALGNDNSRKKQCRAVNKTLGLMETNLRHPSLKTHEYHSLSGAKGEKVFEAYAENKTPAAFRVFWHYGPGQGVITVVAITPHP